MAFFRLPPLIFRDLWDFGVELELLTRIQCQSQIDV